MEIYRILMELIPVCSENGDNMSAELNVNGAKITVAEFDNKDYISLTDMMKAKDGDFFISDWLRNRNTVEFLGVWEQIYIIEILIMANLP